MSGLLADLLATSKALEVHQQHIQTAGRNLAHVNDPSYARQRVLSASSASIVTPQAILPTGIEFKGIEHLRDQILDSRIVEEKMDQASWEARYFANRDLENALGEFVSAPDGVITPDQDPLDPGSASLSASMTRFFNAFQGLSTDPGDPVRRQAVIDRTSELVSQFHQVDERINETEAAWTAQISQDTAKADVLLEKIGSVNQQIIRLEATGKGDATELRDARQAAFEELAQYINFKVDYPRGDRGWARLSVEDVSGNAVVLVDGEKKQVDLAFDPATQALRAGTPPVELDITGGAIHGTRIAHVQSLEPLREQVDLLARQLVTSVNHVYGTATGSPAFFDPASSGAGDLAMDASLDAGTLVSGNSGFAGDNTLALQLADLADKSFDSASGDLILGSFIENVADMTERIGRKVIESRTLFEAQEISTEALVERRNERSGISIDEEVADLMRFQHAFEGSARVMQVLNELLDTIVNKLVR